MKAVSGFYAAGKWNQEHKDTKPKTQREAAFNSNARRPAPESR
jgi:hypothetical protein